MGKGSRRRRGSLPLAGLRPAYWQGHARPRPWRDLTLHGGIDVVGADGGYILAGSHTLQADAPVENVVALIEAARS